MVKLGADCNIVLRAELTYGKTVLVSNTLALSPEKVWIASDFLAPVGLELAVALSFPGLFEPRTFAARVEEVLDASGPGIPRVLVLVFQFKGKDDRAEIAGLVEKMRDERPAASTRSEYRVLIVEDNKMIRDMFAYGVEKYFRTKAIAVSVDLAEDAETAWDFLKKRRYDLAIVDHYLRAMDGAQLVAKIRHDGAIGRLPIVAISIGGVDARTATLTAGADLFLDKPVVMRDLFATLARLAPQVSA